MSEPEESKFEEPKIVKVSKKITTDNTNEKRRGKAIAGKRNEFCHYGTICAATVTNNVMQNPVISLYIWCLNILGCLLSEACI